MARNVTGVYLAAAEAAANLLAAPAVATRWTEPSALSEFMVSGLAGHLAWQVIMVPGLLAHDQETPEIVTILDHYARIGWVDAALDAEINVSIRRTGEAEAADGPAALARRTAATIGELTTMLPAEDPARPVYIPWAGYALTLADFLTSRLMEIVVHVDDLAVSVGAEPDLPAEAVDTVLILLARLSVRRHGAAAVLRAFSRRERAPETIAAF
jgi:hypothetical protein